MAASTTRPLSLIQLDLESIAIVRNPINCCQRPRNSLATTPTLPPPRVLQRHIKHSTSTCTNSIIKGSTKSTSPTTNKPLRTRLCTPRLDRLSRSGSRHVLRMLPPHRPLAPRSATRPRRRRFGRNPEARPSGQPSRLLPLGQRGLATNAGFIWRAGGVADSRAVDCE